ncbi:MAG: amidohydrolase family protein [Candidatus Aminicenantes bacterium]|nr:MAG: amidohydrolase family protein [Candidatus Aminicenantes bacterium]
MKLFRKSAAIFPFIFLIFLSTSGLASDQVLLKNAKIYTMGAPGMLADGMILIKDGKIEKIGLAISAPSGAQVFDLSGKTIIPGLVCASSALFVEKKDHQYSGEERPDTDILEGIHYFDPSVSHILRHGVTTAYISPVSFRFIGGLGAVVKVHSGERGELSILKDRAALNIRLERLQDKKTSNILRLTQYHRIRDSFKQAEEYRKEWSDYETKLKKYEKEKKDLEEKEKGKPKKPEKPKKDESKEILLQAMDKKFPVRFIVHRPDSILQALRLGEEFGLRIILEQSEDWSFLLNELEKTSISLLSNPLLDYRRFLIPGGKKGYAAQYLQLEEGDFFYPYRAGDRDTQKAQKTWSELADSGIPFALIPPDRFPFSARFMRLYAALLFSRGASLEFALGAVTVNAAKILGVADRVGSLEEGMDADLVVLDGEPLDSLSKIEMVFRDGTVVWERKR